MSSERLWVRLPNWLGDVLMARPALHALRASLPAARIRVTGPAPFLDLLHAERRFDEAAAWPADAVGQRVHLRELQAFDPDVALVLPPSFSSASLARSSGAPRRIGFRGEWRSALLTDALARPGRGELHLGAEYLALVDRLIGAGEAEPVPDRRLALPALPVSAQSLAAARTVRSTLGREDVPLALLAPGARYGPAKRWHPARYAELGRRLRSRGYGVAVCGAPEEREVCETVANAAGAGTKTLAGETTLDQLAGLCALAALTVSNDSGFAHLSAAVGARTLVLFGSTSSAWTAPPGPRVQVLQHAPVCSPCFQRTCRIGYACLEAIAVDEVEAACLAGAA